MKRNKMLLLVMMLLPWLSVPFIGNKTFRRFWPGALFICLFVAAESVLAHKKRWWLFFEKFHPKLLGELPLIAGPFFIGSIWIMKFTFGRFRKYLLVNGVVDFLFAFTGTGLLRRLGIVALIRMKKYQFWFTLVFKASLLYGFQRIADLVRSQRLPKKVFKKFL